VIPEGTRGRGFKDSSEMLKNYKELNVWKKSYEFCLKIYRITAKFPNEERQPLITLGCFTFLMVLFVNWKLKYY
jgi:hypothetical protein